MSVLLLTIALCAGILLVAYPVQGLISIRVLKKRVVRVPAYRVEAKVISIPRLSSHFGTLKEYQLAVHYAYLYDGKEYIGNWVFIEGDFSSDKEKIIQPLVNKYNAIDFAYCDPKNPTHGFIEPDISPALKNHWKGLFGGGILVLIAVFVIGWKLQLLAV